MPCGRFLFFSLLTTLLLNTPLAAQTPVFNIRPLGLQDVEHTDPNTGGWASTPRGLTNSGLAIGDSWRFTNGEGWSAWAYNVSTNTYRNLSQTGAEFTRNDGWRQSETQSVTQSGLIYFTAVRYDGAEFQLGQAAFVHDYATNTTRRHGFTDAEHTWQGYQASNIRGMTDNGFVHGESVRYVNDEAGGMSQWAYNPITNTTTNVGLTDAAHTSDVGYRYSRPPFLAKSALTLYSTSERYNGSLFLGEDAWAYEMQTGVRTLIGLTDPEHIRNDGYRLSFYQSIGSNGTVTGFSFRFNGAADAGVTSWAYLPASHETRRVGFFDAVHTASDGYRESYAYTPENGAAIYGRSRRFLGANDGGWSTWVYLPGTDTTRRIGFFDGTHTRADGFQLSDTFTNRASTSGLIFGESQRFSGSADRGLSAWVHDTAANTTTRIGFFGAGFVRGDGFQYSYTQEVNLAGQAAGVSNMYNATTFIGRAAWYFDPITKTSTDISLTGPSFTNSATGGRFSIAYDINKNGVIMGAATRFNGSTDVGNAGLVFDPASNTTTALIFSINPNNGQSNTDIEFLSDNNVVLGYYDKYDNAGNYQGQRVFYWSRERGFGDLTDLVIGGLPANGWEGLWSWAEDNAQGMLLGDGTRLDGNDMAFLLTSVVPEPSTYLMLATALALTAWATHRHLRRRRSAANKEVELEPECA